MTKYTQRRQSKRWLDADCPVGVLAIYDSGPKDFDRYTVFYKEPIVGETYADMWLGYRGMSEHPSSPNGFGVYGEMEAHKVAAYRYRVSKQACKWSSLPDEVKAVVRRDCEESV
jgi:hypothetical protein